MATALAAAILAARRSANLTQASLGALIGVDHGTVYRWETGQREPSAIMLGRIALACGVTADSLLVGSVSICKSADP